MSERRVFVVSENFYQLHSCSEFLMYKYFVEEWKTGSWLKRTSMQIFSMDSKTQGMYEMDRLTITSIQMTTVLQEWLFFLIGKF